MLKINKTDFTFNLNLTQQYCQMQMDKKEKDNAKIFRSINPILNTRPIFSFEARQFDFDIHPGINHCTTTTCRYDPTSMGNEDVVNKIFIEQQNLKQELFSFDQRLTYEGRILVSQFDCSVIDGASEVESLGLIDIYDMPPIDTWFYLTKNKEGRLLFAWIPRAFEHWIDRAISVNFLDLIHWFEQFSPEDYRTVMAV